MIRPWIFEFANCTPIAGEPLFDWYFDLWEQAERIGFEGIFFSEHHFRRIYTTPSPHLLIAALAMRTRTLRLGVMGSVLPLHSPWRMAEEIGMLDHLTNGRLEVGYSSGVGPAETSIAGIPLDEVRPRFDAALALIEQAINGEPVTASDQFGRFGPLETRPQPLRPLPPRWTTVLGTGSAQAAAQRKLNICTGFLSVAEALKVFDAYRAAVGGDCPEKIALRRNILIGDSNSAAAELAAIAEAGTRAEFDMANRGGAEALVPDLPSKSPLDFMFGADEVIHGTVARVSEQIIHQCRTLGAGHMLGFVFNNIPRAAVVRNYQLWEQVIPQLRAAKV